MSYSSVWSHPSKGSDWKGEVYFDPEADGNEAIEHISDSELRTKLIRKIDGSEKIKNVHIYKTPLNKNQWTNALFYHVFVMYETDKYWWSIEKNTEGLTIQ